MLAAERAEAELGAVRCIQGGLRGREGRCLAQQMRRHSALDKYMPDVGLVEDLIQWVDGQEQVARAAKVLFAALLQIAEGQISDDHPEVAAFAAMTNAMRANHIRAACDAAAVRLAHRALLVPPRAAA